MGIGDILGTAAGIFRRSPGTVLPIAVVLTTLQQVVLVAMLLLTREIPTRGDLVSGASQLSAGGLIGTLLQLVVGSLIGAVLTAMIVVLVAEDLLGQRLSVADLWNRVRSRLLAIIWASLITSVLATLALPLLILPGMMLWAGWALTVPALLLERLGPIRAMRRSWQLAWPDVWRVLAIRALSVTVGSGILYVIALPFSALGVIATDNATPTDDQASLLLLFLAAVGSILGGIIMRPFLAAVLALLYLDRRMRAEGMDLVLYQQLRHRRQPPSIWPIDQERSDLPLLAPAAGQAVTAVPGGYPSATGMP
jgi:hypothetical protein